MRRHLDDRTVVKWVAVAAAALALLALGRAVWRYAETAAALTAEPSPPAAAPSGDPGEAFGMAFRAVEIRADAGALSAWQIDGGARWVVTIPSESGTAADGHRVLPAAVRAGRTVLELDRPVPDPAGGIPDRTGWRAVHAAVRYADRQGAEAVTLAAFGGGALAVTQFLTESEFAAMVDGVVLDAAPFDLNQSVAAGMERAGIPGYLRGLAVQVAALRNGIHWAEYDLQDRLAAAGLPMLVLQGGNDGYALPEVARAFAGRMGTALDYVEVAGAAHLQAASADPAAYDAAVLEFLDSLPAPEAP